MVIGIIHNVTVLIALSLLHFIFSKKSNFRYKGVREILMGVIIGLIGVILMMTPWTYQPGIVFDTRTILLSVSGLIIGVIPTIIAMATTALYRIYIAGDGIVMGVATIITAGTVGMLWAALRPRWRKKKYYLEMYAMGLTTHIGMLLCTIFLPEDLRIETLKNIAPTVLIIYPIGTLLLGIVLTANNTRLENENKVKEEVERRTSFFNASRDMMFIKDDKFRYVLINEAICKFFGKSRDEILGKSDHDLLPGVNLDDVLESDLKILKEGVTVTIEEKIGDNIYEATKFPTKLDDELFGIGGIVRDLTTIIKKRNIQEAILQISKSSISEINFKSFLEQVHFQLNKVIPVKNIYIALYHSDTDMYSFPYYVDEFDELEDDAMEVLHGSLTDYVRRSGKSQYVSDKIAEKLKADDVIFIPYGTSAPLWLGSPLYDSEFKEVIGVIAIQDYENDSAYSPDDLDLLEIFANSIGVFIERVKNIESLKVAKFKAEESDRLKTAFLANMSHEIRTPMNGIMGFANILLDEVTDPTHKEYLTIITKSADRLLATINDVLDISRIETGQVVIHKTKFDLIELLKELYTFFNGNNNQNIEIRLSPGSDSSLIIESDKTKIQQILINLIGNAIKFTKEGFVEFGIKTTDTNFIIYVRDTGIGIAEEYHKSVFDRFVQADTGAIREFEGSGLGLAISKLYTELLGGNIWLESKLGAGTTFFVQLPL